MMIRVYKVKGDSMPPSCRSGDYVLTFRRQNTIFVIGDVIVVKHSRFDIVLKRIQTIESDGRYTITGDNLIASTSSAVLGKIISDVGKSFVACSAAVFLFRR